MKDIPEILYDMMTQQRCTWLLHGGSITYILSTVILELQRYAFSWSQPNYSFLRGYFLPCIIASFFFRVGFAYGKRATFFKIYYSCCLLTSHHAHFFILRNIHIIPQVVRFSLLRDNRKKISMVFALGMHLIVLDYPFCEKFLLILIKERYMKCFNWWQWVNNYRYKIVKNDFLTFRLKILCYLMLTRNDYGWNQVIFMVW